MVLDMTYEQVAGSLPLQDLGELQETGTNTLGLQAVDGIERISEIAG
jgi:hypothetical protein